MANNQPCANKEIINQFINEITKDWHQFCDQAGKFEIRCLGENRTPITQIFTLEEVADAVDFSKRMNTIKLNVYMMINPINPEAVIKAGKGARKENILRAHYSFADADDVQGLNGLSMLSNLQAPDIIVTTGTIPHKRQHAYWHFAEPCYDLELWGTTQRRIASEFKTDNAVVDLSRVMRLPGTVSYPSVAKQAKKYVPELVTMTIGIS
jgi:hypothetical protein